MVTSGGMALLTWDIEGECDVLKDTRVREKLHGCIVDSKPASVAPRDIVHFFRLQRCTERLANAMTSVTTVL